VRVGEYWCEYACWYFGEVEDDGGLEFDVCGEYVVGVVRV